MFWNSIQLGPFSLVVSCIWFTIAIFALITFLRTHRFPLLLCSLGAFFLSLLATPSLLYLALLIFRLPLIAYVSQFWPLFIILYSLGLILFTLGLTLHLFPLLRSPKPISIPT